MYNYMDNTHIHYMDNTHVHYMNNTHIHYMDNTHIQYMNNTHIHYINNTHIHIALLITHCLGSTCWSCLHFHYRLSSYSRTHLLLYHICERVEFSII